MSFDATRFRSTTVEIPVENGVESCEFVLPLRYTVLEFKGGGAYGTVISVHDAVTNTQMAIKKMQIPLPHLNQSSQCLHLKRAYREVALIASVKHPNIISFISAFTPQKNLHDFQEIYLVMELMTTTLSRLHQPTSDILTHRTLSFLVYQMLCAVNHMHRMCIIHRDLKSANIVVDKNCHLKVLDFGLARLTASDNALAMTGYVVTRWYRAPEIILNLGYSEKADVWSIGCILAELINREVLFKGINSLDQWNKIIAVRGTPDATFIQSLGPSLKSTARHITSLPHEVKLPMEVVLPDDRFIPNSGEPRTQQNSASARDLVGNMLAYDANERISVEEALSHPYVRNWRKPDETNAPLTVDNRYDQKIDLEDHTLNEWKELLFNEIKCIEAQGDIFAHA